MDIQLLNQLKQIAKSRISNLDSSHDFDHTMRVLSNAMKISEIEGGDLDVVIPSALFHDLVVYPKNHPEKHKSQEESAAGAEKILLQLENYNKDKIPSVVKSILECSFSKGIVPETLESKILQDADGLEATGAISIMRTFSSVGQMKNKFYNSIDPFCRERKPDSSKYGLDLFYDRLLVVGERMHTETAKKIAFNRTQFLLEFLKELEQELNGD